MMRPPSIEMLSALRNAVVNFQTDDKYYDLLCASFGYVSAVEWPEILAYIKHLEGVANGMRG